MNCYTIFKLTFCHVIYVSDGGRRLPTPIRISLKNLNYPCELLGAAYPFIKEALWEGGDGVGRAGAGLASESCRGFCQVNTNICNSIPSFGPHCIQRALTQGPRLKNTKRDKFVHIQTVPLEKKENCFNKYVNTLFQK